jgi:transposase
MTRTSRLTKPVSEKKLEQKLKEVKGFWRVQRVLVILSLHKLTQTSKQLALQFNMSEIAVRKLISAYNKEGESVFEVKGHGGRKNEILTFEQEQIFLKQFFDKAIKGKISTTEEIRKVFVNQTGRKKVAKSTIYNLLKRHGWSKKKTRPTHPKSNKEAQEAFEKTFLKKSTK